MSWISGAGRVSPLPLPRSKPLAAGSSASIIPTSCAARPAAAIVRRSPAGRVEIVAGGLEQLGPFAGRIDKLCTLNVVMFLADKDAAFRAFHAALRPGGRIAVTHMPRHKGARNADASAVAEKILARMSAAGFTDIAVHRLPLKPVEAVSILGRRGH